MWNHKPPSITPRLSAWAQALFPHLRKTFRTNLALFLSTLLLHTPPRPTLSAYARNLPLPYSAQAKLNRLWRFLRHPALQNPWILTRALLPRLSPRAAKGKLLPLLYALRMWIEEGFRDLKGAGLGLDRRRLRAPASLVGWLSLLFLAQVVLVLLGVGLEGRPWLHRLVAHPERQSLFTLGRLALTQPPSELKGRILRLFYRVLAELAGGRRGGRK